MGEYVRVISQCCVWRLDILILVTLGTQDKTFKRLLDDIQVQIDKGNIKDKVVVQAGFTKYNSKDMEIFDLIDREEFGKLISDCDLLITHGGVGSILTGLSEKKKIIACPRLAKYGEHINDHQRQIIDKFYDEGYLLKYDDGDDLGKVINSAKKFKANVYKSNTKNFVKVLEEFIDNN